MRGRGARSFAACFAYHFKWRARLQGNSGGEKLPTTVKAFWNRRAKNMERNKQQIPGIVQKGRQGAYREDVPEHSTGENEGVRRRGSPHWDV